MPPGSTARSFIGEAPNPNRVKAFRRSCLVKFCFYFLRTDLGGTNLERLQKNAKNLYHSAAEPNKTFLPPRREGRKGKPKTTTMRSRGANKKLNADKRRFELITADACQVGAKDE